MFAIFPPSRSTTLSDLVCGEQCNVMLCIVIIIIKINKYKNNKNKAKIPDDVVHF